MISANCFRKDIHEITSHTKGTTLHFLMHFATYSGIVVAAIIIFVIYKQAAASAGAKMSASINQTAAGESKAISNNLAGL